MIYFLYKYICKLFSESSADRNQHAAGRARLRHVRVQVPAAAAADADGPSRPVPAGQRLRPGESCTARTLTCEPHLNKKLISLCDLQGALHLNDTIVPQPHLIHLTAENFSRDGAFLMDCGNVSFHFVYSICQSSREDN